MNIPGTHSNLFKQKGAVQALYTCKHVEVASLSNAYMAYETTSDIATLCKREPSVFSSLNQRLIRGQGLSSAGELRPADIIDASTLQGTSLWS